LIVLLLPPEPWWHSGREDLSITAPAVSGFAEREVWTIEVRRSSAWIVRI